MTEQKECMGTEVSYIVKFSLEEYRRVCRLVERDEKNRVRTRERNRGKMATAPRGSRVKPIEMNVIDIKHGDKSIMVGQPASYILA